ncbi:zinc finger protein CONSTANS-LIKE 16-like isoform X2 [Salvia miltiorrhiza]|uniref:zinc finger protein CONSTANS-LIKE 16-like isoform X2 n=1 Tax=Salvia miltiorrhiza TaxID=226208 RepID=UPI0025AB8AA6|nr:zinc finger protein CONSTANS-LIKE 16-like isoform X2 [Salvia miltiorrhiza]
MVSLERKLANIVGGKSARACDNCVRKRATWYCTADDAFLCQSCDSTVHSANPLARRHERVRLKTVSSLKTFGDGLRISVPAWHRGFTRKARTPRKGKHAKYGPADGLVSSSRTHVVPEISGEEHSHDESNEEQLLYRVPIFDPSVAELCISVNSNESANGNPNDGEITPGSGPGSKPEFNEFSEDDMAHVHGFLPSEMDLAEFAADVESLLGKGLDDEAFDIEGLGILDDERERESCLGSERVKVEDEEIDHLNIDGEYIGVGRETFELNFDYDSPINGEEEEVENKEISMEKILRSNFEDSNKVYDAKKIFLRLDYGGVMSAWDDERSPWTTGERPELNPDDCLSDCLGTCGVVYAMGGHVAAAGGDGGREARVSRYREKRRTRLFSKKIRYEVRKLNAEKRPRMKGRFVKRANFVPSAAFALINK